jgi:nucleoside-diphosphate-sugar epimerase
MARKRVFLTGTTGTMGGSALRHLLERGKHHIVTLVRPSEKNRKAMEAYAGNPALEIVWGDLTHYDDVLRCVTGADIVLHPAAFIAPAADHDPESAWKINVGSAENIVQAIKAQPDPDSVKLVNIGTVAETGDRLPPIHLGRTGDPLKPSIFDMYACSKTAAERVVAESGLRQWVSCRQTFIATTNLVQDPIMFHQPINTCIELCTEHDAGLLLANVCEEDVPDAFWRRFYNIGGGPACRVVFDEYLAATMRIFGIGSRQVVERNWFALRNFHCHWFEDSGILDEYLHYQTESFSDHLRHIENRVPARAKAGAREISHEGLKRAVMEPLATKTPDCTMYWIKNNMEMRITAFFKTKEAWARIPDWSVDMPEDPRKVQPVRLDHGYDEQKPAEELDLGDIQAAARFRGGACLSKRMERGDLFTRLRWRCAFDHLFEATPNIVLKGGHWCPHCAPPGWNYDEEARRNPFFAQVWYPNHDREESNFYPEDCWRDILRS